MRRTIKKNQQNKHFFLYDKYSKHIFIKLFLPEIYEKNIIFQVYINKQSENCCLGIISNDIYSIKVSVLDWFFVLIKMVEVALKCITLEHGPYLCSVLFYTLFSPGSVCIFQFIWDNEENWCSLPGGFSESWRYKPRWFFYTSVLYPELIFPYLSIWIEVINWLFV